MRILLADHHAEPRWALKAFLAEQPEFDLLGEAEDVQGLLLLAEKHTPDLVLLDRELTGMDIEDLIARLHALQPRPIVIVMSSEFEYSGMLLEVGADAFISKLDQSDWLLKNLNQYAKQIEMKGGCE